MAYLIIKSYRVLSPEEKRKTYNEIVTMSENGIILLDPWMEVIKNPEVDQETEQEVIK